MKNLKILVVVILCICIFGFMSVSSKNQFTYLGHPYKEGEILVRFKPTVDDTLIQSLVKSVNGKIILSSRMIKEPIVPDLFLIKIDNNKFSKILNFLNSRPEVMYAEPNYIWKKVATPNDPEFSKLWNLHNTGQTGGTSDADIDAPEAWDKHKGSKSVIVAVVDTGVDYTHPDLSRNMWRNPGEIPGNGIDDDNNGVVDDVYGINTVGIDPTGPGCGGRPTAGDPMDDGGHGTHVAGTIGAYGNNSLGVTGVNWKISIMAVKFLGADGSGTTDAAILGLQYVKMMKDRGYNIIATNNSWGGGSYSRALYDAIQGLMASGILFIAAAGNDALNNDLEPHYPSSYDLPNIISVAATDHNDNLASFSNFGKRTVHVGAPGKDILSTCSASLYSCESTPDYPYAIFSGTSMATPHVTGLAALIKAQDPSRDWKKIKNLILSTGDVKTALTGNSITGKRINAFRALSCTSSTTFEILRPFDNAEEFVKRPVELKALNIKCENPAGPVTVTIGTTTINLRDDGIAPDRVAQDGVYTGLWTPQAARNFTLRFSNGLQTKNVVVQVSNSITYSISSTTHTFNDISTTGTKLSIGDEQKASVTTPFPVKIYGFTYNTLYISDNGALSKDDVSIGYSNYQIPTLFYPNIIAPFWDDLKPDPSTTDAIYYHTLGTSPNRKFIIQWNNVPHYSVGGTNGVTFQVEFLENSSVIYYRYNDVYFGNSTYDRGASATVGIQKDSTEGTQYSYNNATLNDNTSLALTPSTYTKAVLYVEPDSINFYRVAVGKSRTNNVYIYNRGNKAMTVNSLTLSGSAEFSLVSPPTTPFTVTPGNFRKINVKYAPINEGLDTGNLQISTDVGNSTVTLSGTGYKEPDIEFSTPTLNFGSISAGTTKNMTITVFNKGNALLRITDIDIDPPFSIVSPTTLPITISPGSSTNIQVRFAPTTTGTFWRQMIIYSNDPDESAASITLTGIAN